MNNVPLYLALAISAQAFTINDSPNDAIPVNSIYESYGINVFNYTPGKNSGNIVIDLFTNFPQGGETVNGSPPWTTLPADIFITETYYGIDYLWAIPLVSHDGFNAGTMYAVSGFLTSTDLDPSHGTGYIYNPNVPVQISSKGSNYAAPNSITELGGGTVGWESLSPGNPDWKIHVSLPIYQDDPNGIFAFTWGTATCANDIVSGQVPTPEPITLLLMGFGSAVMGGGIRRLKRKSKKTTETVV